MKKERIMVNGKLTWVHDEKEIARLDKLNDQQRLMKFNAMRVKELDAKLKEVYKELKAAELNAKKFKDEKLGLKEMVEKLNKENAELKGQREKMAKERDELKGQCAQLVKEIQEASNLKKETKKKKSK